MKDERLVPSDRIRKDFGELIPSHARATVVKIFCAFNAQPLERRGLKGGFVKQLALAHAERNHADARRELTLGVELRENPGKIVDDELRAGDAVFGKSAQKQDGAAFELRPW